MPLSKIHGTFKGAMKKTYYLNIVAAACCARLTSQNGSNVPIPSVPSTVIPRPSHENQLSPLVSDSCSAVLSPTASGCESFTLGVLTATAVALPDVARLPVLPGVFTAARLTL